MIVYFQYRASKLVLWLFLLLLVLLINNKRGARGLWAESYELYLVETSLTQTFVECLCIINNCAIVSKGCARPVVVP